jgi:hypothetical protein
LYERHHACFRIVFGQIRKHADAPHAFGLLLRPRHHRPRRRVPEPRDEIPPPHPRSPALD